MSKLRCVGCGIGIGQGLIEKIPYPCGENSVCSKCNSKLQTSGKIKLDDKFTFASNDSPLRLNRRCRYLFADGSIKIKVAK